MISCYFEPETIISECISSRVDSIRRSDGFSIGPVPSVNVFVVYSFYLVVALGITDSVNLILLLEVFNHINLIILNNLTGMHKYSLKQEMDEIAKMGDLPEHIRAAIVDNRKMSKKIIIL